MGEEAAAVATVPKVEEISFNGTLTGTLDALRQRLSKIPFYSTKIDADQLVLARVESRNINKKPYLFYMIKLGKDSASVVYSVPPDTSERMRRASVIKDLVSVLAIAAESYTVSETKFYEYIDSVIDDLLKGLSDSYSVLFNKYDALLAEYRELKRLNLELSSSNRNLTLQASQLTDQNKVYGEELKTLQKYSDSALMAMASDWIEVHNSTIDIDEFAKTYGIGAPRVEQILDKMVSEGYLELKE